MEPVFESLDSTQEEALFEQPAVPASSSAPLALYRRYRPDTFAEVIGQEHVTEPLQRALTNNRVNHAYLFSGPRGCGKTTSARILARALNCEFGPRAEPCGKCQSCRDLARGAAGSIDVIEIDAASHGGVDDARDLRERAFFAPVNSRYKIYIVDEAHMVTTAGFNALLKLVEEPPPHVKFVFATTEPDKVISTIRSRTHHYPFRLVPPRVLTDYLAKLCAAEGIQVEPGVLPLVVRSGAGSVRDSLSVLDQLLGGAEESGVSYRHAASLLGYTPDSLLDELVDAFAAGDTGGVFTCVDKVIEVGQDPRRFAEDLLRRLRDLVLVAAVPDALTSGLVEVAPDQAQRLSSQAAALGPGELTRAAEVIATGLTEMRGTTAPRLHLELMCARVLLPGTDVDDRGIHARLDRLERRLGVVGAATSAETRPAPKSQDAALASEARASTSSTSVAKPAPTSPEPVEGRDSTSGGRESGASTSSARVASDPEPAPSSPEAVERRASTSSADEGSTSSADEASTSSARVAGQPEASTSSADEASTGSARVAGHREASTSSARVAGHREASTSSADDSAPTGAPVQLSVTDVRRLWPEVLEEVKGKRRFTWILLSQNAQVADVRDGTLTLAMANAGARDSFGRGGSEDILREALIVVLGADFQIVTLVDVSAAPTVSAPPPRKVWPEPSSETAAAGQQARHHIRSTRAASNSGESKGGAEPADDRDAEADRTDADLDDSMVSDTDLLARHLGAEIIAEEEHGA